MERGKGESLRNKEWRGEWGYQEKEMRLGESGRLWAERSYEGGKVGALGDMGGDGI